MSSSPIGRVITRREGTRAGMCNVNVVKLSVSARVRARLRVRARCGLGLLSAVYGTVAGG